MSSDFSKVTSLGSRLVKFLSFLAENRGTVRKINGEKGNFSHWEALQNVFDISFSISPGLHSALFHKPHEGFLQASLLWYEIEN